MVYDVTDGARDGSHVGRRLPIALRLYLMFSNVTIVTLSRGTNLTVVEPAEVLAVSGAGKAAESGSRAKFGGSSQ